MKFVNTETSRKVTTLGDLAAGAVFRILGDCKILIKTRRTSGSHGVVVLSTGREKGYVPSNTEVVRLKDVELHYKDTGYDV